MYFILYVDRVNIATVAPLLKADLKLSNTQLGLVFSAFAIPYALFQLIGGIVILDRKISVARVLEKFFDTWKMWH